MTVSEWSREQLREGGWIRRMFMEGLRLREEYGDDAVADLSLGQPLEASDAVPRAFHAALDDRFAGRFGYMPNLGYADVRERVAAEMRSDGVSAAGIAMTQGAAAAICVALRTFVEPGDDVVAVAPYFPEFRFYCAAGGFGFVPVTVRDDLTLDLDAMERALTPRTGAVLVNSPSNPSGHVLSEREMRGLAAMLQHHEARHGRRVLLIVDEVYHRFLYPPHRRVDPLQHHERTVLARSFSKDLGVAGERIGYLVLHPSLATAEAHTAVGQSMRALGFVNAPATAQRALLHLDTWELDIAPYAERRALAVRLARDAGVEAAEPQGAFYQWLRAPGDDTLAFVEALASRRVLVTPGVAFGVPSHVRLCFSVAPEKIEMAFAAIAEVAGAAVSA